MRGPLDRFLVRRSDPVDDVISDDHSEQENEEQLDEGGESQQAKPGTLDAWLERTDASQVAGTSLHQPLSTRRRLSRWMPDLQTSGCLPPRVAAWLDARHAARHAQRAIVHTHPWWQPVLDGRGGTLPPEAAGALVGLQFDSQGELLVTGSEEGLVTVHSAAALAAACCTTWPPLSSDQPEPEDGAPSPQQQRQLQQQQQLPASQQQPSPTQPLLVLDTGLAKLQAVRWNPANENLVGVASSASRQLLLYDLQHTQGRPCQVLSAPPASATSAVVAGATAVGMSDLAFFRGSSYMVLAGGLGGQVFMWDSRAKAGPTAVLQSQQSSAVYSVALAPDEQVVLAGTQGGEVKMWDLRGGRSSTLRFGAVGAHHHPLLGAVSLRLALAAVPGLLEQTGVPASAVHSMALDPTEPRRLGIHMGCGWSGVLDLVSQGITHVHAPAQAFAECEPSAAGAGGDASSVPLVPWHATAAPALRRQACWAADGTRFCVPSRREESLMLLDFSSSSAAGCNALAGEAEEDSTSLAWQLPSAAHVALTQSAVCAAAHPAGTLLVAGGLASCMSLLSLP